MRWGFLKGISSIYHSMVWYVKQWMAIPVSQTLCWHVWIDCFMLPIVQYPKIYSLLSKKPKTYSYLRSSNSVNLWYFNIKNDLIRIVLRLIISALQGSYECWKSLKTKKSKCCLFKVWKCLYFELSAWNCLKSFIINHYMTD